MNRLYQLTLMVACIFFLLYSPVLASNRAITRVYVIHASGGPDYVDSSLKSVIFKLKRLPYSSYKLLSSRNQALNNRQSINISLPNKETLSVTSLGVVKINNDKRINYQINFQKKGGAPSRNQIQLLDGRSVTFVRGEYRKGEIVILIMGSIR